MPKSSLFFFSISLLTFSEVHTCIYFLCLQVFWQQPLWQTLLHVFCPFSNCMICFFTVRPWKFLRNRLLSNMWFANIFFQSVFLFLLFWSFAEFSFWWKDSLLIFLFMGCVKSKNSLLGSQTQRFSPVFFLLVRR